MRNVRAAVGPQNPHVLVLDPGPRTCNRTVASRPWAQGSGHPCVATKVGRAVAASIEGARVDRVESALRAQALCVTIWFAPGSSADAALRAAARKLFVNDTSKAVDWYENFIREGHRNLDEDLHRSDESPKLLYMHNDIDEPSLVVLRATGEVHL